MPEFGFPAQPRQSSLASLIANMRKRADDERVAAVTGRFADVASELDGRVSELMHVEKSINDLRNYSESIALSETRADAMQRALTGVSEISQNLSNTVDVLLTNGTDANLEVVSSQARDELGVVVSALNLNLGGRSLFGGDDANTPTVLDADSVYAASVPFLEGSPTSGTAYAALQAEFMDPGGLYDTTIYQGGTGASPLTEIAPGERVDYGVKADEDAMRRIMLNVVVLGAAFDDTNAIPDDQRRELTARASLELRTAVGELTNVQARLGTAEARIATVKSRNIAAEASLTLSYNDLAGADTFAAALSLSELENQLEVAFATTTRLANLSLANFR